MDHERVAMQPDPQLDPLETATTLPDPTKD
jgi:hypothetical protein